MKNALNGILPAVMLLFVSCVRLALPGPEAGDDGLCLTVSVSLDDGFFREQTKSSWVPDEDSDSGYQLMVYNLDRSCLEQTISLPSRTSGTEIRMQRGESYRLFVVGNYWFISSGGQKLNFGDILSPATLSESDFFANDGPFVCRFFEEDHTVAGIAGVRYERFDEIRRYGIPYSGFVDMVADGRSSVTISHLRFLFARISLTIDHSGLDGGVEPDCFKNISVSVRNVPKRVQAFIDGDISAYVPGGDDMASSGDGEIFQHNASRGKWCFYIPENNQGRIAGMTAEERLPGKVPACASYIEFKGSLDPSYGGYGGELTYRFYPGLDNNESFQIPRGCDIRISLAFKASSVFASRLEPLWRIESGDDFADTRLLAVDTAGKGCPDDFIGSAHCPSDAIMLRRSDSRSIPLYYNRRGLGYVNEVSTSALKKYVAGYSPASVLESALRIVPDSEHGDAADYSRHGISASVELSSGRLVLSVSDPSLFREGEEYVLYMELYPGGKRFPVKLRTCADKSVYLDAAEFYTGMKRQLRCEGFCGQPMLRVESSSDVNVLSTSASVGSGSQLGLTPVAVSSVQDLFACGSSSGLRLRISSSDVFNDGDGEIIVACPVLKPVLSLDSSRYFVPIDGTEVPLGVQYKSVGGSPLRESDFVPELYSRLLSPRLSVTDENRSYNSPGSSLTVSASSVIGMADGRIFMSRLHPSASTSEFVLGSVYAEAADASLGINTSHVQVLSAFPSWSQPTASFGGVATDYFDFFRSSPVGDVWEKPALKSDYLGIWLRGCSIDGCVCRPISGADGMELWKKAVCEFDMNESGESRVRWSFTPENFDEGMLSAPYGRQVIGTSFTNRHSGEIFSLDDRYCDVSHESKLTLFLEAENNGFYGKIHFGTALSHYLRLVRLSRGLSGSFQNLGYGIQPKYSYCVPEESTGIYPRNAFGEKILSSGGTADVMAAFFTYAGQEGEWELWKYETRFSDGFCRDVIRDWNDIFSGQWYGHPDPTYFYRNEAFPREMSIPDSDYPLTGHPGLSSWFRLMTDGHPPYAGYCCR